MYKKLVTFGIIASLCACFFAGCGQNSAKSRTENKNTVASVLEEQTNTSDSSSDATYTSPNGQDVAIMDVDEIENQGSGDADIDLTKMTSDLVYASVYNILMTPNDYVGKTIKMQGIVAYSTDESTNKTYAAIVIKDATACCAQGLEFVLEGDSICPDGYPSEGAEATVIGTLSTYEENGTTYVTAKDAKVIQ